VDFGELPADAEDKETQKRALLAELRIAASYVAVGVDRLDYTKGIIERFQAVELLLERYPRYQGQFTLLQIGAPSRTDIPRYADFQAEVESEALRINERFARGRWQPILLLNHHEDRARLQDFYGAADVCLVTSLHDGMNLVAKEFVSAQHDEQGVLILSRFTGAARELRDALIVNPYDIRSTADAIARALEMEPAEVSDRMRRMRVWIREHNIFWWASTLIGALCDLRVNQNDQNRVSQSEDVPVLQ
jgi:trehalose-6-phosphate synthase